MADDPKTPAPDGKQGGQPDGGVITKEQFDLLQSQLAAMQERYRTLETEKNEIVKQRDKEKADKKAEADAAKLEAEKAAAAKGDVAALQKANEDLRKSAADREAELQGKLQELQGKYEREMHDGELVRRIAPFTVDPKVAALLLKPFTELAEQDGATALRPKGAMGTVEEFSKDWLTKNAPYLVKSDKQAGNGVTKGENGAQPNGKGSKYSYEQLAAMSDAEYAAAVRSDPGAAKVFAAGVRK